MADNETGEKLTGQNCWECGHWFESYGPKHFCPDCSVKRLLSPNVPRPERGTGAMPPNPFLTRPNPAYVRQPVQVQQAEPPKTPEPVKQVDTRNARRLGEAFAKFCFSIGFMIVVSFVMYLLFWYLPHEVVAAVVWLAHKAGLQG